jgi:SagB-type dehydrogenase family enzyme
MTAEEVTFGYHEQTKHHFNRSARSLGYLDWATQPDPFRRFAGTPLIRLPLPVEDRAPAYELLYQPGAVPASPLNVDTIGMFFECSLAISAWKEYQGERWALRCNPSSGNLHPTEGYLVAGPIEGLSDTPAVYHYAPKEHALEARARFEATAWRTLTAGFPEGAFFAGLSSIPWREAWKYGERAYRYCQHDAGHALAAFRLAAAMLGWRAVHLESLGDAQVAALLGLDRADDFEGAEREHPDALLAIAPGPVSSPGTLPDDAIRAVAAGNWLGHANALSKDHVDWQVIELVAEACAKPATEPPTQTPDPRPQTLSPPPPHCGRTAYRIIQQRRSAVAFDGETGIGRDTFYRMLSLVAPALNPVPWDALAGSPCVHLGLFVHRVDGISPGLYCLARDAGAGAALRAAMTQGFVWKSPEGCPGGLSLFLLHAGDYRRTAATVSCAQEIASDGAFSLGMIAEFEETVRRRGPWYYRRLFWECGMIGQVLYLEAEAAGVRGTGIGCYFDDPVHELFGLTDRRFQSLYHFTVGGPVDDPRLTTLPAYPRKRLDEHGRTGT